jgi:hypothetical protein
VLFRSETINISNLKFDPENPRLPTTIDGNNESQVLEWMLNDGGLLELVGSIGEHGYFPGEPLLATKIENAQDLYMVVEGNRRLAAVKLLCNPDIAPKRKRNSVISATGLAKIRPSTLPCLIFSNRNEILVYLGYRHVTGIKTWGALQKARYLSQLYPMIGGDDDQSKFRLLAKKIGSRTDYVAKLLTGLALYKVISDENYFGIRDLDEETISFSLLTTSLSYSNITNFIGLNSATDNNLYGLRRKELTELVHWIFEKNSENVTRLGESRNLDVLSKIVANPKALEKFRSGRSLSEAGMYTDEPDLIFHNSIDQSYRNIQTARDTSHLVERPTQTDAETLKDIAAIARNIKSGLDNKFGDELD